jgi:hypothetical protein
MDVFIGSVEVENSFRSDGTPRLLPTVLWYVKFAPRSVSVIALGGEASKRLNELGVKHFKLPHPSGLNRKLNDKQEISRLLYRCKKFIYK